MSEARPETLYRLKLDHENVKKKKKPTLKHRADDSNQQLLPRYQ